MSSEIVITPLAFFGGRYLSLPTALSVSACPTRNGHPEVPWFDDAMLQSWAQCSWGTLLIRGQGATGPLVIEACYTLSGARVLRG